MSARRRLGAAAVALACALTACTPGGSANEEPTKAADADADADADANADADAKAEDDVKVNVKTEAEAADVKAEAEASTAQQQEAAAHAPNQEEPQAAPAAYSDPNQPPQPHKYMSVEQRRQLFEERIRIEPRDGEAWLALIEEAQSREDMEATRALYDRFFKVFPSQGRQWLAYLEQLHPSAIDMGLERSREIITRHDRVARPP